MKLYSKSLDIVNKILQYVLAVMFMVMLASSILQVIIRYLVFVSMPWTEELCRYIFSWLVLLGSACTLRAKGHTTVTLLTAKLSVKGKYICRFLTIIALLCLFYCMIVYGTQAAQVAAARKSTALRIHMNYIYMAVPVSGVLMALYTIDELAALIRDFCNEFFKKGGNT